VGPSPTGGIKEGKPFVRKKGLNANGWEKKGAGEVLGEKKLREPKNNSRG